jgi:hypothetical protein
MMILLVVGKGWKAHHKAVSRVGPVHLTYREVSVGKKKRR